MLMDSFIFCNLRVTSHAKIERNTSVGACAQIAVFTYAVMRRMPRYEIRLAAPFADNLMNSVAHCGGLPINVERLLRHIYELSAWLVT